ncbi:4-oxalocrotonate tautomerase family protein [Nocardiopsis sp. NPDC006938]|uniref:tautomerase family protein n=1 Tax=Nocardiopsis sp. NPDC006938 TaxID=3364337 RepID=UPI0036996381
MPLIEVTLTEGRDPARLRALMKAVHEAVETSLDTPASSVRVIVREVPPALWSAGGTTLAERRGLETPGTDAGDAVDRHTSKGN